MTADDLTVRSPIRIVVGDANALYSRVLRDFLLYAAARQLISIRWSPEIIAEVVEHLIENVDGFDDAAAARLVSAMNDTFPTAQVAPDPGAYRRIEGLELPDGGDRHVIAAALTAEADVICTNNRRDFPPALMAEIGVQAITVDELLSLLVVEFGEEMAAVHRTVVSRFPSATDASTLEALRRAGGIKAADLIAGLLRR